MPRGLLLLIGVLALVGPSCGKRPKPVTSYSGARMMATPGIALPVVTPPVQKADAVNLPDDLPVVGVVVNGRARAYSLLALSPLDRHVVNDLIDDVPVSVAYCDIARCLRVYTHEQRGEAIDLSQTGRTNEGLLLKYEGRMYAQMPGTVPGGGGTKLPLETLVSVETTWKAWRQMHPNTEVYTGEALPAPPNNL